MSRRDDRRAYPDNVRLDLLEDDQDRSEMELATVKARVSSNRSATWGNITSFGVGVLVLIGAIATAVMK